MSTPFERNIQCLPEGDDRYRIEFDDAFLGPGGIYGGVSLAATLEAANQSIGDPEFKFRSASTAFLSGIKPGPLTATVRILRRGRSLAQAGVSLRDGDDKPALETTAIFGCDREGLAFLDRQFPDVPDPEDCPSFDDPPDNGEAPPLPDWATAKMWNSIEQRIAIGHRWWERDWESDGSFGARWLRYRDTPRLDDGKTHPLSAVALTDMAGPAIESKVGPESPEWVMVSADHYVQWLAPAQSDWLLLTHGASSASSGFASVNTEVWDRRGTLVAVSAQAVVIQLL